MKLSITKVQFESLDFQAQCGKLSSTRGDYVYNLVKRDGKWLVDFGDGFEEAIEFQPTIGDMVKVPKAHCDMCAHYGGFCGNCDGSHWD